MTSYFINMEKRLLLEIFTKKLKKKCVPWQYDFWWYFFLLYHVDLSRKFENHYWTFDMQISYVKFNI